MITEIDAINYLRITRDKSLFEKKFDFEKTKLDLHQLSVCYELMPEKREILISKMLEILQKSNQNNKKLVQQFEYTDDQIEPEDTPKDQVEYYSPTEIESEEEVESPSVQVNEEIQ